MCHGGAAPEESPWSGLATAHQEFVRYSRYPSIAMSWLSLIEEPLEDIMT